MKIKGLAINFLREKVFKDEPTVDSLAGLLYRLVTTDQEVKDLFCRLFCELLTDNKVLKQDIYDLTHNSIHDYLTSEIAVSHLSKIIQ